MNKKEQDGAIKLIFPYPPSQLLPNKKLSWQAKMVATRQARKDAYYLGLAQRKEGANPLDKAIMLIRWYPPSWKLRDFDSQLAALKPIIDGGLIDAGFIRDDSPNTIQSIILQYGAVDRKSPRTEIILWRAEAQSPCYEL